MLLNPKLIYTFKYLKQSYNYYNKGTAIMSGIMCNKNNKHQLLRKVVNATI